MGCVGTRDWCGAAPLAAPSPSPSPCPPKGREEPLGGVICIPPSMPFTPGVSVGTPGLRRWDRGTLFYALKPRYPQPWAALGRDLGSGRQH